MPGNSKITGIAEIAISVKDIQAMKSFYMDVMGFQLHSQSRHEQNTIEDPEGRPTIVFLTIADTDSPLGKNGHPQLLVLIDYQRHIFARQRLSGHNIKSTTLNHLAFEIPPASYETQLHRLKELELDPRETTFDHMQARSIFFNDPEGNVLELISHWPT